MLGEVLAQTGEGGYDVTSKIDCTSYQARLAIEQFFADARPTDVHLLYFSCHGIQDADGELYFAFTDTRRDLRSSTAVSADWVRHRMQASRSRSIIVLVDCCFSGAFLRGMQARSGTDANVGSLLRDLPEGAGVAVLTASGATEFSLEDEEGRAGAAAHPSYFTEAVVTGIATGAADLEADGHITADELYRYVYRRIVDGPSPQRPRKLDHGEGQIVVADVGRRLPEPPLPPEPPHLDATLVLNPDQLLAPWPPLPQTRQPERDPAARPRPAVSAVWRSTTSPNSVSATEGGAPPAPVATHAPRSKPRWLAPTVIGLVLIGLIAGLVVVIFGNRTQPPTAPAVQQSTARTTAASSTSRGTTRSTPAIVLADGQHVAYLTTISMSPMTITFDLVEFLTGAAANQACITHNAPECPPPNDYFIVNDNAMLRTLPVAQGVRVKVLASSGGTEPTLIAFTDLPAHFAKTKTGNKLSPLPFRLTVTNGMVVAFQEMYLP